MNKYKTDTKQRRHLHRQTTAKCSVVYIKDSILENTQYSKKKKKTQHTGATLLKQTNIYNQKKYK